MIIKTQKNRVHKLIAIIFIFVISTPLIYSFIEKDIVVSKSEHRKLSKKPKIKLNHKSLKAFPKKFEKYYSDHFGFRHNLTTLYNEFIYTIGGSSSDLVIRGKDGWMFLGTVSNGEKRRRDPLGDYRNVNQFTNAQLIEISNYLSKLNKWLERQDINYYLVIAPTKLTIYNEFLPDYINKVNEQSAMDQFLKYLLKNTSVKIIDLRKPLLESKINKLLYYKTGTHWNLQGGNVAQFEIMKKIQADFPDRIVPQLYDDSIFVKDKYYERTLERLQGVNLVKESDFSHYPKFKNKKAHAWDYINYPTAKDPARKTHTLINEKQALKIIIYRDSFFKALKPYFEQKFYSSTYIWEQSTKASLEKYIKTKKPHIVLEEWGEKVFPFVPINKGEFDDNSAPNKFQLSTNTTYYPR